MSTKFNWGHGLALALLIFVIFISQFVFRTFFSEEADHKLTSEEYYKEELNYQKEIDSQNNGLALKENITTRNTLDGIEIVFPSDFDYTKIKGDLKLQRPSNKGIDIINNFTLKGNVLLIPKEDLIKGYYNLKVNWEYAGISYQYREKIEY